MSSGVSNDDPEYLLGRRISVIGKGGKTTLSKALAERFDLELIEQDAIRHQANWVERSNEEHLEVLMDVIAGAKHGWVSDGNYRSMGGDALADVETVIALALPLRVMLWRTFKRSFWRAIKREELWNGNRESFWEVFFTNRSVIYDVWIRRERFRSFAEQAEAETPDGVRLIIIRSSKELNEFYEKHALVRR
jgi:adenylate kinase family enzyme